MAGVLRRATERWLPAADLRAIVRSYWLPSAFLLSSELLHDLSLVWRWERRELLARVAKGDQDQYDLDYGDDFMDERRFAALFRSAEFRPLAIRFRDTTHVAPGWHPLRVDACRLAARYLDRPVLWSPVAELALVEKRRWPGRRGGFPRCTEQTACVLHTAMTVRAVLKRAHQLARAAYVEIHLDRVRHEEDGREVPCISVHPRDVPTNFCGDETWSDCAFRTPRTHTGSPRDYRDLEYDESPAADAERWRRHACLTRGRDRTRGTGRCETPEGKIRNKLY